MIAFRDGGHDFVEVVAASYTQGVSPRSRRAWGAVATAMVTPSQGMEHAVGLQLVEITVALQVAWWPDLADVSLPDDLLFARLAGMDLATAALNFFASSSTVSHHGSPSWRVTWTSRPPMLQRLEGDMALRTRRVEFSQVLIYLASTADPCTWRRTDNRLFMLRSTPLRYITGGDIFLSLYVVTSLLPA